MSKQKKNKKLILSSSLLLHLVGSHEGYTDEDCDTESASGDLEDGSEKDMAQEMTP